MTSDTFSQPHTGRNSDHSDKKPLTADQVAAYLKENPDFFINRDSLLAEITLPHESGKAISLLERQVRVLRERSIESRLTHGFHLLLGRKPSQQELKVLTAAVERSIKDFTKDAEAAKQLLTFGEAKTDGKLSPAELAAYTTVASTLINLDETITKE